jgi:hypothetical protein
MIRWPSRASDPEGVTLGKRRVMLEGGEYAVREDDAVSRQLPSR